MTLIEIKKEIEGAECAYSRATKGTEEHLRSGLDLIVALNKEIQAIEQVLGGVALITNEDALRVEQETATRLREDLERARKRKLQVGKEVGGPLIQSWLADESGYDEAVWPAIWRELEENRSPPGR